MMIRRPSLRLAAALIAAACAAPPAEAHHSFAMFDMNRTVVLTGTITAVHWSNPHIWIDIMAQQKGRPDAPWGVEAGATGTMIRQGWKKESVKPGDKVTVHMHPLRNGEPSGSLIKVVLADGRELLLGAQGARPN